MPKFVLIDHSLKDLGGHHYPYAHCVLSAAERDGWQPVLAANRRFSQRATLPTAWRIHALYAHESYSRHTFDTQAQQSATAPPADDSPARSGHPLRAWWRERARRRLAAGFARDCARLFELEPLARGDVVFVSTTSELDLLGLTAFLGQSGVGADCDWHLQFHFGVFTGREPDYAAQSAAATTMRTALVQALSQSGPQRLHFYCTTGQLTAQYQRLGVAQFTTLPYPVHEYFQPRALPPARSAPLRIACLGHSRREKGYGQLPQVLRELWSDWFAPQRAQLVLQTHRGGQRRALEALIAALAAADARAGPATSPATERSEARSAAPCAALDFAAFPLPLAGYARLLCGADVGLLLYDSTRYYARCSGVLLEMLCAGVPVLVPAGGWLAAQIEDANQAYLDAVAGNAQESGLATGRYPASATPDLPALSIPDEAAALLLTCEWRADAAAGVYLRLELEPLDSTGGRLRGAAAIVGARDNGAGVHCLFRLPPGTRRVRLRVRNAWRHEGAPISGLSWAALRIAPPLGALGLTFADSGEVPRLLQEILEHMNHYQRAARAHAAACARSHSGARVLAGLGARIAARSGTT